MMAPGFRPVKWVGAVAVAAIGCYMLSLNVAAERAELARVEHQIVATKQQIRSLHTELGTRGRLAQLEQWNAEVLALSAPTSAQFLGDEMMLARFEQSAPSLEDRAAVRLASAETGSVAGSSASEVPAIQTVARPETVARSVAPLASPQLVRKASLEMPPAPGGREAAVESSPAKVAPAPRREDGSAAPARARISPPKPLVKVTGKPDTAPAKLASNKPAHTPVALAAASTKTVLGRPAPTTPTVKSPLRERPVVLASAQPAAARPGGAATVRNEKPKTASRIGDSLAKEIGAAAKAEARAGGR